MTHKIAGGCLLAFDIHTEPAMSAPSGDPQFVRFGDFTLDLQSGELTANGRRRLLPEQPFRILTLLVRSPGTLVTREELRRELWRQDTFVDFEHGLNAAIKRPFSRTTTMCCAGMRR